MKGFAFCVGLLGLVVHSALGGYDIARDDLALTQCDHTGVISNKICSDETVKVIVCLIDNKYRSIDLEVESNDDSTLLSSDHSVLVECSQPEIDYSFHLAGEDQTFYNPFKPYSGYYVFFENTLALENVIFEATQVTTLTVPACTQQRISLSINITSTESFDITLMDGTDLASEENGEALVEFMICPDYAYTYQLYIQIPSHNDLLPVRTLANSVLKVHYDNILQASETEIWVNQAMIVKVSNGLVSFQRCIQFAIDTMDSLTSNLYAEYDLHFESSDSNVLNGYNLCNDGYYAMDMILSDDSETTAVSLYFNGVEAWEGDVDDEGRLLQFNINITSQSVDIFSDCIWVRYVLLPDNYPGELSLFIMPEDDYNNSQTLTFDDNLVISDIIELCYDDSYIFIVNDSYGDGFCCENGSGIFLVYPVVSTEKTEGWIFPYAFDDITEGLYFDSAVIVEVSYIIDESQETQDSSLGKYSLVYNTEYESEEILSYKVDFSAQWTILPIIGVLLIFACIVPPLMEYSKVSKLSEEEWRRRMKTPKEPSPLIIAWKNKLGKAKNSYFYVVIYWTAKFIDWLSDVILVIAVIIALYRSPSYDIERKKGSQSGALFFFSYIESDSNFCEDLIDFSQKLEESCTTEDAKFSTTFELQPDPETIRTIDLDSCKDISYEEYISGSSTDQFDVDTIEDEYTGFDEEYDEDYDEYINRYYECSGQYLTQEEYLLNEGRSCYLSGMNTDNLRLVLQGVCSDTTFVPQNLVTDDVIWSCREIVSEKIWECDFRDPYIINFFMLLLLVLVLKEGSTLVYFKFFRRLPLNELIILSADSLFLLLNYIVAIISKKSTKNRIDSIRSNPPFFFSWMTLDFLERLASLTVTGAVATVNSSFFVRIVMAFSCIGFFVGLKSWRNQSLQAIAQLMIPNTRFSSSPKQSKGIFPLVEISLLQLKADFLQSLSENYSEYSFLLLKVWYRSLIVLRALFVLVVLAVLAYFSTLDLAVENIDLNLMVKICMVSFTASFLTEIALIYERNRFALRRMREDLSSVFTVSEGLKVFRLMSRGHADIIDKLLGRVSKSVRIALMFSGKSNILQDIVIYGIQIFSVLLFHSIFTDFEEIYNPTVDDIDEFVYEQSQELPPQDQLEYSNSAALSGLYIAFAFGIVSSLKLVWVFIEFLYQHLSSQKQIAMVIEEFRDILMTNMDEGVGSAELQNADEPAGLEDNPKPHFN